MPIELANETDISGLNLRSSVRVSNTPLGAWRSSPI